jgi:hypothetical protein
MRKIQLDLGNLRVESFAVEATPAERGTVQGQAASYPRVCTGGGSCSGPVACICQTCCTDVCIC